jgi:putative DNA primase/helicase
VRSKWQYVVAAGSYVPVTEEELQRIPIEDRQNAGYYTVDNAVSPVTITFDELPQIFKDTWQKKHSSMKPRVNKITSFKLPEKHSKLYDITVFDIYRKIKQTNKIPLETNRWGSLFHDSKTGANMSITDDGLLHCWRHNYSFNALQSLAVLSGYMSCEQAGTPHSDPDCGKLESEIVGDNGAIFHAWKYAKENGYIPLDDPIPVKAMYYIADKHLHYRAKEGERLPANIYRQVIKIVEDSY